jgi:hypothetical protein
MIYSCLVVGSHFILPATAAVKKKLVSKLGPTVEYNRSLNAIVTHPKNCPFGVNTAIELRNIVFGLNRSINSKWAILELCQY